MCKSHFILIFVLILSSEAFSQKDISEHYFPREKLVLQSCEKSIDKDRCVYDFVQEKTKIIAERAYKFENFQGDTLKIQLGFEVTKNGKIDDYLLSRIYSFKNNKV